MNKKIKILAAGMSFILGTLLPSHAQYLLQSVNANLTAYDTVGNRTVHIGTRELIQNFAGTNVPNGQLYLVTPLGNPAGFIGNLNAFLRITSGTTTVLEIPSPNEFNLYQDYVALRTNGAAISTRALNRFSIDSGSIRAELQGISTWSVPRGLVNGADVSGTGSFQSSVNGWISIYNVTESIAPVKGTIAVGNAKPGP